MNKLSQACPTDCRTTGSRGQQVKHIPEVAAADPGASVGAYQSLEAVVCWWGLKSLGVGVVAPPAIHDMRLLRLLFAAFDTNVLCLGLEPFE